MTAATKQLVFTNPATGEEFGQMPQTTPEQVRAQLDKMRSAFPTWSSKSVSERVAVLRKFQAVLIDATDEITEVINYNTGKTRQDALIELFMTVDMLDTYLGQAKRWLKSYRVPSRLYLFKKNYVEPRPYGVVAVIAPWNYPLALAMPPVLGALLAGNTVVLKPSEVTPAVGLLMQRLFERVPELSPYVRVVHGDGGVGAALVEAGPDYIFLTGSIPTGRAVARSAAQTLTPLACELGGKDAMIVLEDADLQAAARWGVWGAFFNSGQTCMGVERVYVHESVYVPFVKLVLEETQRLRMGYSPAKFNWLYLGPITDPRQLKIIRAHLDEAVQMGAKVLAGGEVNGNFVTPTVLVNVSHEMRLMREETFGPLMPIMPVASADEAVALANDCDLGLGASVWSRDLVRARNVARRVEASAVIINDTIAQFAVPTLPFGGIKQSGYGRIHGKEGVMQFTRPYAYSIGQPPPAFDIATIMRTPGNYTLGKSVMKLTRGVTPAQRLEPVGEVLEQVEGKLSAPARRTLAFGALSLAALAAAVVFGRRSR